MSEPGREGQQSETPEDKLKKEIGKTLEDLRPFTKTPPPDQLPKGVSAEQWADMKNLTDLLDIVKGPANPGLPPTTQGTSKQG